MADPMQKDSLSESMKYHFVYETGPGEKILEVDTDEEPPEPGDSVSLRSLMGPHRLKRYIVDEVYLAPPGSPGITIIIEVEPLSRKKPG
jgi:hypothetical protein